MGWVELPARLTAAYYLTLAVVPLTVLGLAALAWYRRRSV
jgi:hypothetical protein